MPIDLYYTRSPPSRAVRLVAHAVGVDLNLKMVNILEKDQLKPEFVKMNPQHTVPTLDDNGFYLWESRAICTYLIEQYAKNDSLYPKDPKQRAVVNQRLYFDMGTLYNAFFEYFYPQVFRKASPDPAKAEKCHEALAYVEKFLEGQKYIAGNHLTVADIIIAVDIYNFKIVNIDYSKYKNIVSWMNKVKSEVSKFEEISDEDLKMTKAWLDMHKK